MNMEDLSETEVDTTTAKRTRIEPENEETEMSIDPVADLLFALDENAM
jgi:hypothetical protein